MGRKAPVPTKALLGLDPERKPAKKESRREKGRLSISVIWSPELEKENLVEICRYRRSYKEWHGATHTRGTLLMPEIPRYLKVQYSRTVYPAACSRGLRWRTRRRRILPSPRFEMRARVPRDCPSTCR